MIKDSIAYLTLFFILFPCVSENNRFKYIFALNYSFFYAFVIKHTWLNIRSTKFNKTFYLENQQTHTDTGRDDIFPFHFNITYTSKFAIT